VWSYAITCSSHSIISTKTCNVLVISWTGAESTGVDANGNSFDFTTKLLHLAWHPTENSIACAAANSLYMYYAWGRKMIGGHVSALVDLFLGCLEKDSLPFLPTIELEATLTHTTSALQNL